MLTIKIPPEIESPLRMAAEKEGTTPELLALDNLRRTYAVPHQHGHQPVEPGDGETMYDYLKEFIGVISSAEDISGGARMSEKTGEQFTDYLMQKHKEGRL